MAMSLNKTRLRTHHPSLSLSSSNPFFLSLTISQNNIQSSMDFSCLFLCSSFCFIETFCSRGYWMINRFSFRQRLVPLVDVYQKLCIPVHHLCLSCPSLSSSCSTSINRLISTTLGYKPSIP